MPGQSPFSKYAQQAVLIACVAVACALAANALDDGPSLLPGSYQPATDQTLGGEPVPVITVQQARQLLGSALFIDARGAPDYRDGHLPGAASLPVEHLEGGDVPVVVYCSDPACGKARQVAQRLAGPGLRVLVMEQGIRGWAAQGGALEVAQ